MKAKEKLRRYIDDCRGIGAEPNLLVEEEAGRRLNAWLDEDAAKEFLLPMSFRTGVRRAVRKA